MPVRFGRLLNPFLRHVFDPTIRNETQILIRCVNLSLGEVCDELMLNLHAAESEISICNTLPIINEFACPGIQSDLRINCRSHILKDGDLLLFEDQRVRITNNIEVIALRYQTLELVKGVFLLKLREFL